MNIEPKVKQVELTTDNGGITLSLDDEGTVKVMDFSGGDLHFFLEQSEINSFCTALKESVKLLKG